MKKVEDFQSISRASPDGLSSAPLDVSGSSDGSSSAPLDVSASPDVSSSAPLDVSASPDVSSSAPLDVSASPDVSSSAPLDVSASPDVSSSAPLDASGSSDGLSSAPLDVSGSSDGSSSALPDVSSDKKNKIMRWASGNAHNEHIQNSLLIMLAIGIIIGGASKEIINPLIVCIVGITTPLTMLTVVGGIILVFLIAIAAVIFSNVIGIIIGGVFGVFVGSVIVDIIIGVIVGVIGGTSEKVLLIIGVGVSLWATVNIMSSIYSRGRRNYIAERVVTDELYKVKCQQWRIFRGLKSNEKKSKLFHLCQQWRIFFGLKNECYIDHIIVCNKGVFCVETKTLYKKPQTNKEIVFDKHKIYINENEKILLKQKQIKQVFDNANWLYVEIENYCNELEEKKLTSVIPIITFPGWTVQGGEKGEPNETIVVCNHEQILKRVNGRDDIEFDEKEINKICEFLESVTEIDVVNA